MKKKVSEKDWRALLGLDTASTSKRRKKTAAYSHGLPTSDGDRDTVIEKTGPGHNDSESSDTVIEKKSDSDSESRDSVNEQTAESRDTVIEKTGDDDSESEKKGYSDSESRDTVIEQRGTVIMKRGEIDSERRDAEIEKIGDRKKLPKRKRNTLKIYKQWLGFKASNRVLIDGSVLVHFIENNLHLKDLFQVALQEANLELYTTNCIFQEVLCYLSKYSSLKHLNALTELKEQLIIKCCGHKQEVSALDCMKFVVGEDNKYKFFVATNDKWFSENPLIPVLSVDKGVFGIKYLTRKDKRRALKLYSQYSLTEPAVMEDDSPLPYDHPESPQYKRLMARIEFYRFAQIKVVGDGNCLSRALSEQLTHSEWKYKQVRQALVKQMLSNKSLYEEKVQQLLESDPEFQNETYSDYVNRKSKDKESGDSVMIQAAADRFEAKLVCLCSLKTHAILEYFPRGKARGNVVYHRVLYLASLERSHADSIYPKSSPSKHCRHRCSLGSSV